VEKDELAAAKITSNQAWFLKAHTSTDINKCFIK
jgi:hypothetical protein